MFPGMSWMGFGGAHEPLKSHTHALHALHVGDWELHGCYWVWKAFMTLKSLRVTAIHSLKAGKKKTLPSEKNTLGLTISY